MCGELKRDPNLLSACFLSGSKRISSLWTEWKVKCYAKFVELLRVDLEETRLERAKWNALDDFYLAKLAGLRCDEPWCCFFQKFDDLRSARCSLCWSGQVRRAAILAAHCRAVGWKVDLHVFIIVIWQQRCRWGVPRRMFRRVSGRF